MIMKRLFDIVFSFVGIVILSPVLVIISLIVALSSKGGSFYKQKRVGKDNKDFTLYKFRSMRVDSDKQSLITIGNKDSRVTPIGYYLRKYKIDELPQLFNVLKGDMSFVGPRPEVRYYVDMYTDKQKQVLNVRPGITDPASIAFRNENELLAQQPNPKQYYITSIMPEKLRINLEYINNRSFSKDIKIILQTIKAI